MMPWVCEKCENPCFYMMPLESCEPDICGLGGEDDFRIVKWRYVNWLEALDMMNKWWEDMNMPLRMVLQRRVDE